jgi:uncharacterized coiled-coil DUF342 family protein
MVMVAIMKSEQTVLAKVESLSTDLSAQIVILATEVNIKIDLARHDTCLNSANIYSDKVVTLEEEVTQLSLDVIKLTSKVEDLEKRQRPGNGASITPPPLTVRT